MNFGVQPAVTLQMQVLEVGIDGVDAVQLAQVAGQ